MDTADKVSPGDIQLIHHVGSVISLLIHGTRTAIHTVMCSLAEYTGPHGKRGRDAVSQQTQHRNTQRIGGTTACNQTPKNNL